MSTLFENLKNNPDLGADWAVGITAWAAWLLGWIAVAALAAML